MTLLLAIRKNVKFSDPYNEKRRLEEFDTQRIYRNKSDRAETASNIANYLVQMKWIRGKYFLQRGRIERSGEP